MGIGEAAPGVVVLAQFQDCLRVGLGISVAPGNGMLNRKTAGPRKIYWQGPSIGWDIGGNASKVFTLIYRLKSDDQMFQRYPGVDGSVYLVAGFGVNYQQSGKVILAPIRTGVGLRAGANVGYLHYNTEHSWLPFERRPAYCFWAKQGQVKNRPSVTRWPPSLTQAASSRPSTKVQTLWCASRSSFGTR
ncbi:MAG: EipA family protein [Rhodospirillaceae bacterium]